MHPVLKRPGLSVVDGGTLSAMLTKKLGVPVLAPWGYERRQQASAADRSGAHLADCLCVAVPTATGSRPVLQQLGHLLPGCSAIMCRHWQQASAAQRLVYHISDCCQCVAGRLTGEPVF